MKVFIVDDDPDFAEGIALTLEIEGHEVDFARSGEEAVRKFRTRDFDVTLMDIRMPGMNGVESMLEIRKLKPDAKFIMMTAYSVENLLHRSMDEGAMGVLHKPVDSEALLSALTDVKPAGVILVADDDSDFAEGMKTVLNDAGYSVNIALSGEHAVEMAIRGEYDVLILDVRLPVLNGLEVYRELKRLGKTLPTIVVTGFDIEEAQTISELRSLSVATCLVKPVGADQILQAIKAFV